MVFSLITLSTAVDAYKINALYSVITSIPEWHASSTRLPLGNSISPHNIYWDQKNPTTIVSLKTEMRTEIPLRITCQTLPHWPKAQLSLAQRRRRELQQPPGQTVLRLEYSLPSLAPIQHCTHRHLNTSSFPPKIPHLPSHASEN